MVVVVRIILRGSLIWFEEERLWESNSTVEEIAYPAGRMGFSNERGCATSLTKLRTLSDTKEGVFYAMRDDSDRKGRL